MPAMMKSIGQPSLETLTDACENPATDEKQHANQNISQVHHGNITSTPRKSRGGDPFGEPAQGFHGSHLIQVARRPIKKS
jgi:hypothetical protein